MFNFKPFKLFDINRIPVYLDPSVALLALYMAFLAKDLLTGLLYTVLLLGSILLHELAHTVVGIYYGGRVSGITLQLLGGCAMFTKLPTKPWQELLMAAAGPLCSLLLGVGLFLLMCYLPSSLFSYLLLWGSLTNFVLAIFNLLPAFPMDGGRILRAFLQLNMSRKRATWWAASIGRYLAIYMMITGVLSILGIDIRIPGEGLTSLILNILLGGGSLMRLLIGWMIYQAAQQEYFQVYSDWRSDDEPDNFFTRWKRRHERRRAFETPPDDDEVLISPPPYERSRRKRRTNIFHD